MIDKTEAPERIMAWWLGPHHPHGITTAGGPPDGAITYIREDVAQAMVAAALQEAAKLAWGMEFCAEDEFRRLITPDDAPAALARLIAEAVNAEREACALIAYDADDCIMARNAIRARKSPPAD